MMINGNLKLKRSMNRAGSYDEWIEAARAFDLDSTHWICSPRRIVAKARAK
jgi:hypothetical protein